MKNQYKAFSSDISVVEGERAVAAIISTDAVDRDGEVLIPQGMNAKDYQLNPVGFFNHAWAEYGGEAKDKLPVGQCVAIAKAADSISFKFIFAERPATYPQDQEWLPDTLLSLYQQGVMRAFSVGFMPVETRAATDKDLMTFGADCRRVVSKWKLFEVSCVPLPCNQEAVALAVSKKLITRDGAKSLFGKSGEVTDEQIATAEAVVVGEPAEGGGVYHGTKSDDDKSAMGTCSECGKEFPVGELDDDGMCADCNSAKSAEPQKRVVAAIPMKAAPQPAQEVKHVRRVVDLPGAPATDIKTIVRKTVVHQILKERGRLYAD
jgi:hypothetical protein